MFVQQFFVRGLAHSSYLLGGDRTCAIVDPARDVQVYLEAAKSMGMRITHVLETHLHADFISGHLELAELTGAEVVVPGSGAHDFAATPVGEGDVLQLESMTLRVLDTPGHTPEHISYVVTDNARGPEPVAVFCGDTLFVGDVGRPDLFPGLARELANQLYDSLHGKLLQLPDFCEVLPAHGAGSLCGRAMGAKRTSTIGYERRYNAALQFSDREEFITSLTTNMPGAPDHFSRCSAINGQGPALVDSLPALQPAPPAVLQMLAARQNTLILDTRPYEAFGGQHIPGSYHVDFGGNFATFCGWILPPGQDILLVSSTPEEAREAALLLRRVGLDQSTGYLEGGMYAWVRSGLPTAHVPQLSSAELHALATASGQAVQLVDTRAPAEYGKAHIEGAVNIPAPDLRTRAGELDPQMPTVVICGTGHRSSMAASLLLRQGFTQVLNAAGGMMGYSAAGYAAECPMCVIPHGPSFLGK